MDIREHLKRFDYTGDGKVGIEDAAAVLNDRLSGKTPAFTFGLGIAVGAVVMFFLRPLL